MQPMKFGWRIVLGSFVGFIGAAFGSVGGVGGGGIFVPMLTLIMGFDPKSSTAMSKCEGSVHLLQQFVSELLLQAKDAFMQPNMPHDQAKDACMQPNRTDH
jgi:hypothetical protein